MTAIAYRNGILAAATACYRGSTIVGYCSKIVRIPITGLFAAAGHSSTIQAVERWLSNESVYRRPEPLADIDDFDALLIGSSGRLQYIDGLFEPYFAPEAEFHAIGCHATFLRGAMAAGASAEEAVRLAVIHTDAAGEVQVVRLEEP